MSFTPSRCVGDESVDSESTPNEATGDVSVNQEMHAGTTSQHNHNEKQPANDIPAREAFEKKYKVGKRIGSGGSGVVYAGVRKTDNMPVAIKHVRIGGQIDEGSMPREVLLMERITPNKHVIQYLDWYMWLDGYLVIMERPERCQDLYYFINEKKVLDEDTARAFFWQVLLAVDHCHKCGVFHGDIKNENLLVDLTTNTLKLIDFSAAITLRDTAYMEFGGTRVYAPPEWFSNHYFYARSATVWSLGILLYEMVCGDIPFRVSKEIKAARVRFNHPISSECKDLIRSLLSFHYFDRPELEEIMVHPWIVKGDFVRG